MDAVSAVDEVTTSPTSTSTNNDITMEDTDDADKISTMVTSTCEVVTPANTTAGSDSNATSPMDTSDQVSSTSDTEDSTTAATRR